MAISDKEAALRLIQQLPDDVTLDEIIWALDAELMFASSSRAISARIISTMEPQHLVDADRSARMMAILGISRQVACDIVTGLPDDITLDEIIGRLSVWSWPDEAHGK